MKSTDHIEQVLRTVNVKTREETDARILADASEAFARRDVSRMEAHGTRCWRMGAVVATVLVAGALALVFLGNGNSIALADVKARIGALLDSLSDRRA